MPTAWEDPPGLEALIATNARRVLAAIASSADRREAPTIAMAQEWHRDLYDGIPRPFDYYAGEVRDSDQRFPDLIGYEVRVGNALGVPSANVPDELNTYETGAQTAAETLDSVLTVGAHPSAMRPQELHGVLTYCALLHGGWVRIHPFANGNGRTARLWANWAALRYGLPPFVTVKPRPGHPYALAAMASMGGDHQVTVAVFDQMLQAHLSQSP
jgi:Fic family protein